MGKKWGESLSWRQKGRMVTYTESLAFGLEDLKAKIDKAICKLELLSDFAESDVEIKTSDMAEIHQMLIDIYCSARGSLDREHEMQKKVYGVK